MRAASGGLILPILGTIIPDMRIEHAPSTRLADVLFSPVQQRVLALLFGQPGRSFQSAELITLAGSGTGAVHRQLVRLADSGLVTVTRVGNQKHYQANRDLPVFLRAAWPGGQDDRPRRPAARGSCTLQGSNCRARSPRGRTRPVATSI